MSGASRLTTHSDIMQAPSKVRAVQVMNISLRMLHISKQAPLARPLVSAFQRLLRETPAGAAFFTALAKPQAVKNVLSQAYCDATAVDDELVECILKPGLEAGAVKVFLDFIRCAPIPLWLSDYHTGSARAAPRRSVRGMVSGIETLRATKRRQDLTAG